MEQNATTTPVVTIDSPKVAELKAKQSEIFKLMQTANVNGASESEIEKLISEYQQAKRNVQAEVANEQAQKIAEQRAAERSERVKIVDELLNLKVETVIVVADKKATIEEKNEIYARLNSLIEKVKNAVAGSPARVTSSAPSGYKPETGIGKAAKIVELYLEFTAKGMTEKEARKTIEAQGFNDGTIGNAIVSYRRANGLM